MKREYPAPSRVEPPTIGPVGAARRHPGPLQVLSYFTIFSKEPRTPTRYSMGRYSTADPVEAREKAKARSRETGLPLYEISPLDDPEIIVNNGPDAIYLAHICKKNLSGPIRDRDAISLLYSDSELARIARHGPPSGE